MLVWDHVREDVRYAIRLLARNVDAASLTVGMMSFRDARLLEGSYSAEPGQLVGVGYDIYAACLVAAGDEVEE